MQQNDFNFGIPELKPCFPDPDDLEILDGFLYRSRSDVKYPGIMHFYTDDFRFSSIWIQRKQFVSYLYHQPAVKYIVSPDFSCYRGEPRAVQLYNLYRRSEMAALMQAEGYKVIPSLNWSDTASFCYAFEGLPAGACYAVSFRQKDAVNMPFWSGLFYFLIRFSPALLFVFCSKSNRTLFHQYFNYHNRKILFKLNYVFVNL